MVGAISKFTPKEKTKTDPKMITVSLNKIKTTNQKGIENEGECKKAKAEKSEINKNLSAIGSMTLPKKVSCFNNRAR